MIRFLFCFLFLFSAVYSDENSAYIPYVDELQQTYAKQLQKSGLQLTNTGGALFNDVNKIALGFVIKQNVNVDQARQLFVKYAEPFRQMINASRKIRPYLHQYPATIESLKFSLSFQDECTRMCCPPNIRCVCNYQDKICYYTLGINQVHEETYEEALRIVQNSVN